MAKVSSVNNSSATGAVAIYTFKTNLKNASFTIPKSSDGTTYNSSGDQISSGSSGAGGMANNSAWFVVQDPGSRRQWSWQRDSGGTNTKWRVKFSESSGFTGGSPGATQTPSATDEQILLGGGTDASPTFATLFDADAGYKFHTVAFSDAINGVYDWIFGTQVNTTGGCRTFWASLSLQSGTYNASDVSPMVMMTKSSSGANIGLSDYNNATEANNNAWAWFKYGLAGQAFKRVSMGYEVLAGQTSTPAPGASNADYGVSVWDSTSINEMPIRFGRPTGFATVYGPKGSTARVFGGSYYSNVLGDFTQYSTDCRICWSSVTTPTAGALQLWIPWPESTGISL